MGNTLLGLKVFLCSPFLIHPHRRLDRLEREPHSATLGWSLHLCSTHYHFLTACHIVFPMRILRSWHQESLRCPLGVLIH